MPVGRGEAGAAEVFLPVPAPFTANTPVPLRLEFGPDKILIFGIQTETTRRELKKEKDGVES